MNPITVSQLNSYVKAILDIDKNLRNILITGEVSNFKKHSSGNLYFSLKDSNSTVKAVMFLNSFNNKINKNMSNIDIKDGIEIVVQGNVRCYETTGSYQIYVDKIFTDGSSGINHTKLEKLKLKLLENHIFDENHKKAIPQYPQKIGVITSETGSVIQDIKKVVFRRFPVCEIILYPVEVQGKNSVKKICSGIKHFNNSEYKINTIIIARGGGSNEDLSVFDTEEIAMEIYNSKIPIISAVGHETDFTICDLVADKRASTPSVAAEIATPDINNLKNIINNYQKQLENLTQNKININFQKINLLENLINIHSPVNKINNNLNYVLYLEELLIKNFSFYVAKKEFLCENLTKKLENYSRNNILNQGYALIYDNINKNHIKSISEFDNINKISIIMKDGQITCDVNNIKRIF